MALRLEDGDYLPDGLGGLRRAEGREALVQRVLFRLQARRGTFPFLEELGSRLWKLGGVSGSQRQSAAEQYVAEALAAEDGLQVDEVSLVEENGTMRLTAELTYQGEDLAVTLEVQ